MPLMNVNIKKIAVFRALYLGDMLCIIPTIRAIRYSFPKAEIYLIGLTWQKEFRKRFAVYFDHFIPFPGWPGLPEQIVTESESDAFIVKMRGMNFDLALQMQGNGIDTNRMVQSWGAKMVCGLSRASDCYENRDLFPISEDDEHEVLRFLKIPRALNLPLKGPHLEFPIDEHEIAQAGKLLSQMQLTDGRYICIHAGARDPRRRWPAKNFAMIADNLIQDGWKILLTGSVQENELLSNLESIIDSPVSSLVRQCGDVGIGVLASIMKRSALLVSNDTGVSHVAVGLEIPSVIIFSPYSHFARWAPLDRQLHTCITVEEGNDPGFVLTKIRHQLDRYSRGHLFESKVN